MKKKISITALLIAVVFYMQGCKKTTSADSGMAGVRVWTGTEIRQSLSIDSGIYSLDTMYYTVTTSFPITVLNNTMILNGDTSYLDTVIVASVPYSETPFGEKGDTLKFSSSDNTAKTITFTSYFNYGGPTGEFTLCMDTIIYNYSRNSMVWHEVYQDFLHTTIYLSLHTP